MTASTSSTPPRPNLDPERFTTHWSEVRGFRQAYVREGAGGVPLVCVHGWPETKRIWWRVIEPLAEAGLRGDRRPTCAASARATWPPTASTTSPRRSLDVHALVHDELGHDQVVVVGGDLGGPIIQDLALRFPDFVDRMVLFNSPLPYDKERMAGMHTRPASAHDYFVRQGTDADALAAELATPGAAPPLHRHLLHVAVLGPSRRVRRRQHRLPHRAVRRRRQAARLVRGLRVVVLRGRSAASRPDRPQRRHPHAASCSARPTT